MPLHNGQVLIYDDGLHSMGSTAMSCTNFEVVKEFDSGHRPGRWRDTHKQQWNTLAERREIRRRRRQAVSKNRAVKRRHK